MCVLARRLGGSREAKRRADGVSAQVESLGQDPGCAWSLSDSDEKLLDRAGTTRLLEAERTAAPSLSLPLNSWASRVLARGTSPADD